MHEAQHKQGHGLVDKEGEYEPFNPDLARRGGPFSSFGPPAQHGQGSPSLGTGLQRDMHGAEEAYKPPDIQRDGEGGPTTA